MANKMEILLEAERRGLLDGDRSRLLAEARRRGMAPDPLPVSPSPGSREFGFLNAALASGLGAPVDLANMLMFGAGGDRPLGGRESIRAAMRGASDVSEPLARRLGLGQGDLGNLPDPQDQPQTWGEHIARGVGTGASAVLPVGGVTNVLTKSAKPLVQRVASQLQESMVRSPWLTGIYELFASGGSGVGRKLGEERFPDNPAAQSIAELAFGLGIPLIPTAFRHIARAGFDLIAPVLRWAPGTSTGMRIAEGAVRPFTESGGRARASRRLRSLAEDPDAAAARIEEGGELSAATRTGDENLLALERSVLETDVKLRGKFIRERTQTTKNLRREIEDIGGGGQISATRKFIGKRVDRLLAALDSRLKQSATLSKQRISELSPNLRATEASTIVREEIESALKSARIQEVDLWTEFANISQQLQFPLAGVRATYVTLRDKLPRAQRDNIPENARRFLDPGSEDVDRFGDSETAIELHGLYSALREDGRIARSVGKRNEARIADEIADSILDALEVRTGVELAPKIASTLKEAITYSRLLNEKFHRGAVGKLLGYAREGGARVDPQETLDRVMRPGRGGAVATRKVTEAIGEEAVDSPAAMEDFIRKNFIDRAVVGDTINPSQAKRFFTSNEDLLNQFPKLRKELFNAKDAQDLDEAFSTAAKAKIKRLTSPSMSRAAKFFGSNVDDEIKTIIASDDPVNFARRIQAEARKDPTGGALKGLKGGVVDYLLRQAGSIELIQGIPESVIHGGRLMSILGDKKTALVVETLLTKGDLDRLKEVAKKLALLQKAMAGGKSLDKIMADLPNTIINLIGTTLGARAGAQLGAGTSGASLKTASFMSGAANKFLGRLTNDTAEALIRDAVIHPDSGLFAALLRNADTPQGAKIIDARLNAWLVGVEGRYLTQDEESEETE
jgi:hypothetical protein